MAIEPIGSVTAAQVQTSYRVQPVETSANTQSVEATSANSATPKMDDNTAIVAKASEADTQSENNNEQQADLDTIRRAVEDMNKNMGNTEAVFGIHDGTNRVTIKLVDKETRELIKELPPEKTLDMIAKVWEMAGILVDEKR